MCGKISSVKGFKVKVLVFNYQKVHKNPRLMMS